jgi:predicted phage tail protein
MNISPHLSGSGGGGGGGGSPTITPDTLLSKDIVEFTLGVQEGPIAGLINGPRGFYLDDTPLVSPNGENNFNPFELHVYHGDVNPSPVRNILGGTTSNSRVGVNLSELTPVVRTSPSSLQNNIDRLEVRLKFNTLVQTNDNGDQLEETARFKIKYRAAGSPAWLDFFSDAQESKLTITSTNTTGYNQSQKTITKTVDIPATGNFAEKDPIKGGVNYHISGQVADTSTPGYNVSKAGSYGKLYLNTTNHNYKYVVDHTAVVALNTAGTDAFDITNGHHTTLLDVVVRNPEIIEITGKTTSGYVKDFVKGVPRQGGDWEIQVTKISPDNKTHHTVSMAWESTQFVTQENRSYDNLAVIRGLAQASDQFTGIPRFSGVYGCLIVKVPSNYDPTTRYCTGAWDGTFKLAHTDNPAWCLYDLLTNELYGLKRYYSHLKVDRYSFYDAAKWCDGLVPRPGGGYQPRFTYNDKIEQSRDALELAYHIAGIFGAIPITDLNGTVRLKLDKPGLPTQIFGAESITPQGFQYSFSDVTQRPNDILVKFINTGLEFEQDARQVFDQTLINKAGRIPDEMIALGCNDVFEAQRRAYRRLLQANTEIVTVTFQTARMGLGLELFDLIGIIDPNMNWGVSGRVKKHSGNTIHLRDPLYLPTNTDLDFQIQTKSGVHDLTVRATQLAATELSITAGSWPSDAPQFAQFGISATAIGLVKPFRILSIQEVPDDTEKLMITALEQNVNKYSDADNMTSSGTVNYASAGAKFPDAPVVTNVESGTNHLYLNSDGKVISRIFIEWDHNPSSFVDEFEIHYRRRGVDQNFRRFRAYGQDAYIENVQDKATYEIFVKAVNALGRKSHQHHKLHHTVVGKTAKPGDVTDLVAYQSGPDVRLEFTGIEDLDLSHYAVRLGTTGDTWSTAKHIGQSSTNSFVDRNIRHSPAVYFVKAVDTSDNQSGTAAQLSYAVPSPGIPTATFTFNGTEFVLDIAQDPSDDVPVKEYIVRQNGNIVFQGKASRFSGSADWVGARSFDVTVTNQAGLISQVKTVTGTVVAPAAPVLTAFIAETSYYLNWNAPVSTLPISHYVVKDLTDNRVLEEKNPGGIYSGNVNWIGQKDFEVYAVDSAGNVGTASATYVSVSAPNVTGLQSNVSRSILKLSWTGNKTSLPIRKYWIYTGASFASAVELARIGAETYSFPVEWNGTKTFYVVAVDTAGNLSVEATVVETIDPPGQPEVTSDIVDQNVHLTWSDASTELLVTKVRLENRLEWRQDTFDPAVGEAEGDITNVVQNIDHLVISTKVSPTLQTSGSTTGFQLTLPKELTKQWYEDTITVRVKAATSGVNPGTQLQMTYSTNEVGNADIQTFTVDGTASWYEFSYPLAAVGSGGPLDNYIGIWGEAGRDVGIWEIELLTSKKLFQHATGSATTFPAKFLGTTRFFATPIDEAGNYGATGEVTESVEAPGTFTFNGEIRDAFVDFSWASPTATLPIDYYEIRRGATQSNSAFVARVSSNNYNFPADWLGTETFWIIAYDTARNASPVQNVDVEILAPTAPVPRSEVIDNNVLLRWSNGVGTLPITATEIRKGAAFADAEVLQKVDATFATFFEFQSGDYDYWLVEIDTAGNYGTPVMITTVVSEPPDFVLQTSMTSDFSGTKNMVIESSNGLLFGIDETKTLDDHFQDNGYDTPQQQIDGGYPIFIQPIDHLTPASYQEEFNTLGVLKSSIITVTPTLAKLAGDGEIEVDIEFRETVNDPWIKHTNKTQVYAQNFQFIRFTLRLVADSKHDLIEVSRIDMRLNVKIRNDAGSGQGFAVDTSGTQVNFNVNFVDVASITVTPNTTTPVIPVYDFLDTQNPTGFTVYLFDKNGNRVDGDFSWAVRGY